MPLELKEFDYALPDRLIARKPVAVRDQSRLLILNREKKSLSHRRFSELETLLRPDDVLVLNDSKVIPARLRGKKSEGWGAVEILLLEEKAQNLWWGMLKPGKRMPAGSTATIFAQNGLNSPIQMEVREKHPNGRCLIRFSGTENILEDLNAYGEVPLPPYIGAANRCSFDDANRYQTVYAQHPGSAAAPTAGLHFSETLLKNLQKKRNFLDSRHTPRWLRNIRPRQSQPHRGSLHARRNLRTIRRIRIRLDEGQNARATHHRRRHNLSPRFRNRRRRKPREPSPPTRPDKPFPLSSLRISVCRRANHKLSPPQIQPAHARQRLCLAKTTKRNRTHPPSIHPSHPPKLPLLQLRGRHAYPIKTTQQKSGCPNSIPIRHQANAPICSSTWPSPPMEKLRPPDRFFPVSVQKQTNLSSTKSGQPSTESYAAPPQSPKTTPPYSPPSTIVAKTKNPSIESPPPEPALSP